MRKIIKLKKGDLVEVLQGKDKGRQAKIKKMLAKEGKAVVEGLNLFKRHLKPTGREKSGGIVERERPFAISKLALICPGCGKKARIGYQLDKAKNKQRICRKCRRIIEVDIKGVKK